MDMWFWLVIGVGVGAVATYIWARRQLREVGTRNFMTNSTQHGNYQTRTFPPPAAANYSPPNPDNPGGPNLKAEVEALKTLISNLQQAVGSLQDDIRNLTFAIKAYEPNQNQLHLKSQNAMNRPLDTGPRYGTATAVSSQGWSSACAAYRKLSFEGLRDLPVEPLFVVLDIDSSARGSAIGETKRHFNESETKQSAFVIFPEGEKEGWIFPNPRISFTEAMKYVFHDLSYDNFEEAKDRVEPQRVRSVSQGAWETVAT